MKMLNVFLSILVLCLAVFSYEISFGEDINYFRLRDKDRWQDRYDSRDRWDYRNDRRRFYDDDYYERRCENQAERKCRSYKDLYWEYIDLSEHYRRLGRMSQYYQNRRKADEALEDYRDCISKELLRCRRDYWRERRGYY